MSSSSIAKHYEIVKHHNLAGLSDDADLPEGVPNGLKHEMERLEKFSPVEFGITKRYLSRYVPADAIFADVGVGGGHYSEHLIRRGGKVHMIDVAVRLLAAARERLVNEGLGEHILSATHASATDLSFLPDESCDAVLMLGPFYHLSLPEERLQASGEAYRVLRKGGVLLAAGISRLTMLDWAFSDRPENILDERSWLEHIHRSGGLAHRNLAYLPSGTRQLLLNFRLIFLCFSRRS